MARPLVSVIIIAHKNSFTLEKVLTAAQSSVSVSDELILVLNNPSFEVENISRKLHSRWVIVRESRPGPQMARIAGANRARHDYLVFLDDDIAITVGWIEAMISHFNSPWVAAGQATIHFEKHPSLYWNYMRYVHLNTTLGFYKKFKELPIIDTAAMMVKRSWYESLKGFNPDYTFCEDTEFTRRIHFNGAEAFHERSVPVTQIYNPGDSFLDSFRKVYLSGEYVVMMRKLYKQPKHEFFEGMRLRLKTFRRFYLKNPVFFLIDVVKATIAELGIIPHLHELDSYPRLHMKSSNKNKIDLQ